MQYNMFKNTFSVSNKSEKEFVEVMHQGLAYRVAVCFEQNEISSEEYFFNNCKWFIHQEN